MPGPWTARVVCKKSSDDSTQKEYPAGTAPQGKTSAYTQLKDDGTYHGIGFTSIAKPSDSGSSTYNQGSGTVNVFFTKENSTSSTKIADKLSGTLYGDKVTPYSVGSKGAVDSYSKVKITGITAGSTSVTCSSQMTSGSLGTITLKTQKVTGTTTNKNIGTTTRGGTKKISPAITMPDYPETSVISKTGYHQTGGYCYSVNNTNDKVYKKTFKAGDSLAGGNVTYIGDKYFCPVGGANNYSIKFDGNGATSGSMSNQSATYDTDVVLNANGFSRTGYTFSKWTTNKDGTGQSYSNKGTVRNLTSVDNGEAILYAQGNINSYTLTANGGTGATISATSDGTISGSTATKKINYGSQFGTLPTATRNGYIFKGGSSDENATTPNITTTTTLVKDTTIYAVWQPGTIVSFRWGTIDSHSKDEEFMSANLIPNSTQFNSVQIPNVTGTRFIFTGGRDVNNKLVYTFKDPQTAVGNPDAITYGNSNGTGKYTGENLILYAHGTQTSMFAYYNNAGHGVYGYAYDGSQGKQIVDFRAGNTDGKNKRG